MKTKIGIEIETPRFFEANTVRAVITEKGIVKFGTSCVSGYSSVIKTESPYFERELIELMLSGTEISKEQFEEAGNKVFNAINDTYELPGI